MDNVSRNSKKIFNTFDLCQSQIMRRKNIEKLNAKIFFLKETLNLQMKLIKTKLIISMKNFLWLRFWITANVHRGEEIFCLKTHKIIKKNIKI